MIHSNDDLAAAAASTGRSKSKLVADGARLGALIVGRLFNG